MRRLFIILISLHFLSAANAQELGYKTYNLLEGNQAVKLNTIYKSNDGLIYAGTTNGLYSFDGIYFKKISFGKTSIKDTVTAIFQDNTGIIWVGCKSGRIAKKNNSNLEYFEPEEGHPAVAITAFLQDNQNNIWFATNGEGIYYFNKTHLYLIDNTNGLSDLHIHTLVQTDNGDMLAATDQGINICKMHNGKVQVQVIGPKNGLPDYYVTSIAPAGNNRFWVGLQEKGFCLYDHNNGSISITESAVNWEYGQVNALLVSQKLLWIGTEENGLFKQSSPEKKLIPFNNKLAPKNKITNLLQDNEGNIWMNTSNELVTCAGNRLQLMPFYDKPVFESIHALLCDHQNNFWLSSKQGLVRFTPDNGNFNSKKFAIAGLNNKADITCLYEDANHHIWIGTLGNGILILDPQTGQFRNITENPLLKNASILSITGNGNTVCAGGLEGVAMIFTVNEANKNLAVQYNYTNYNNIENIGSNYIYCIYKDTRGRIWFGTGGKGITVLEKGRFTHYGKENGLQDEHIYSFTEDLNGNIWFNTKSAGVYCFNGKNFKRYGLADGVSDLEIIAIKTGPGGNIILVNKKGIDLLDVKTGSFSYLDNKQGIAEVNTGAGTVTQDTGRNIAFCSETGVVMFTPAENATHQPKTIIEDVQLFLTDVDKTKPGRFTSDQNIFQFYFTGIYYSNPDDIRYQYKLEGLDTSWISTRDRNVSFLRLQPGTYKFHIRSSLNENFQGADEATYSFEIEKPLWQRTWFIMLGLLLFVGLIYAIMKRREKNLKNLQQLQQEKIQFQFQVLRNQVNPHFLFNSFNTLISTIEDNPTMAVAYVEQLSEFFRNIVNYRDKDVISIREELDILENYFYLQQKRYGNNLVIHINIPEEVKDQSYIPPLTLQLLLENAIKHNAVSKERQLVIELLIENDKYLLIKNNINPKITRESGAGMGLQNIISRYNLLSKEPVSISNDGKFFIVSLPILKQ